MAEDYSDLDPNKVVLSFRGRGDGTEVNIVDKCLEEILLQRQKEAVERAMVSTSRNLQEGSVEAPEATERHGDSEESDIEIRQVATRNFASVKICMQRDVFFFSVAT